MKKFGLLIVLVFFLSAPMILAKGADTVESPVKQADVEYVPGELLVKYEPSVRNTAAETYRTKWGISTLRSFYTIGVQHVKLPKSMTVSQALKLFQSDPSVAYAEPNFYYHLDTVPNDKEFPLLWGMHNTGQMVNGTVGTADADIDAPEAWDRTIGSGVIIAVIDSGLDKSHPDLAANLWTHPGEIAANGIDDDGNGYIDDIRGWDFVDNDNTPNDAHGHGTHVAGTIAAVGNNGIGVAGVSWGSKIMTLRAFDANGFSTTASEVAAIEYANGMGAQVINASWGGYGFSQALKDVIDASSAVVVCAAGNEGLNTDIFPHYPSGYPSPNILSVAATDQNDSLAFFSNFGPTTVDVAAPGVNILSTLAAVEGGGYGYKRGTSMAAPHVSGLAALIRGFSASSGLENSSVSGGVLSNLDIVLKIKETVDPLAGLSGRIATGGRINAYNAIQSVDDGGDGGGGGCFIATAAFGSVMEAHVTILRKFRDKFLMRNRLGKTFIKMYYTYSPALAHFIVSHNRLRMIVRLSLIPVVALSWVALQIGPVVFLSLLFAFISSTSFFIILVFRKKRHVSAD